MTEQTRILTRRLNQYEPCDLQAYEADGGLRAVRRALAMDPAAVRDEIRRAGLTGRGGAGFPSWEKWEAVAGHDASVRYLICNAEECELGTFKDRVLLEGDPFAVLEGMVIAAYASGAREAYIYFGSKLEACHERWSELVDCARDLGLVGEKVMGTDYSFNLRLALGRGSYVAGEELALIASLEGRRPTGRPKPPYPDECGLFGKPTLIHNVETLANVTVILADGPEAYRSRGLPDEPGTRLFSLSGDVCRPGIYELAIGSATLEEFIMELGGGTPDGVPIKAVQPGGGTSPLLDTTGLSCRMCAADLEAAGSGIGTGAVLVYSRARNILEVVARLLDFYGEESCGRCLPCRLGTVKMAQIVHRLLAGRGTTDDLANLGRIAQACVSTGTCGMGQSFPLPVVSALKLFPEDFECRIEQAPARNRF